MKLDYFLNKIVTVEIDRPKGTLHKGTVYPVNYGFIPGIPAEDGEDVDVYILGEDNILKKGSYYLCRIIALIQREGDETKLIGCKPFDADDYSEEQIEKAVRFREQKYTHQLIMGE